ncbi:MAG: N-acetyltransferase [Myxococcales bacterium]|nr:MAG: N-acetyltransferase [Myxococcales bacterium]
MEYLIRAIEPKDLERVLGIITRHKEEMEDTARDFFRIYFDSSAQEPRQGRHYVVETEDDLVAVGGFIGFAEPGYHWVGFLYVDPYFQGQGIGTRLLERIAGEVSALGARQLLVSIDPDDIPTQTVRFYEVNGFASAIIPDASPPLPAKPSAQVWRKML